MDVLGSTLTTEVWARARNKVWVTSKVAQPGFTHYYAEWRYPTVDLWRRLGPSNQNPFVQERRVWQVFVTRCSWAATPLAFMTNGLLAPESFQAILQFSPAVIPATLVHAFLKRITLSQKEIKRIEQECMVLWRTEGGSIRNPHPILEEVITAMGLHEKFGIATWPSLNDVHVKTYTVIRKVMEVYSICMNLNMKDDDIRKKASRMAGISHLTGG